MSKVNIHHSMEDLEDLTNKTLLKIKQISETA
jgi:hypothetical protein